jgi:hypothetical protein
MSSISILLAIRIRAEWMQNEHHLKCGSFYCFIVRW